MSLLQSPIDSLVRGPEDVPKKLSALAPSARCWERSGQISWGLTVSAVRQCPGGVQTSNAQKCAWDWESSFHPPGFFRVRMPSHSDVEHQCRLDRNWASAGLNRLFTRPLRVSCRGGAVWWTLQSMELT